MFVFDVCCFCSAGSFVPIAARALTPEVPSAKTSDQASEAELAHFSLSLGGKYMFVCVLIGRGLCHFLFFVWGFSYVEILDMRIELFGHRQDNGGEAHVYCSCSAPFLW